MIYSVMDLEAARAALLLAMGEYLAIRETYAVDIYGAVFGYLNSSDPMTPYKSQMKQAMVTAFFPTAEVAWQDGGSELPLDEDTYNWMKAKQDSEIGYINDLFARLKMMRTDELTKADAQAQAQLRADLWTKTLDGIYANVKALGAGNLMLTFGGESGQESCDDCKRLMGKRKRASWWVKSDLVPPNRNFLCGGFRCEHVLYTDDGKLFSI